MTNGPSDNQLLWTLTITVGAHPCYWRGSDDGARGMEAKLKKLHAKELTELRAHYEAELAIARSL